MRRILFLMLSLVFLSPLAASAASATYKIDKDHSTVSFKIRHLFSQVRGNFRDFEGTIQFDPQDLDASTAEAKIKAESIDTNVEKRDAHLRSKDFFDTAQYPDITFKGTKFTKKTEQTGTLEGLLSLHGVEKPVILDVEIHGVGKDPWGNTRAGFTGATNINRKDFGLNWNETLETGGVLVGDEVEIILDIEGLLEV